MNRIEFLKRLGLVSGAAIAAPLIAAELLKSETEPLIPCKGQGKMTGHWVMTRDKFGNTQLYKEGVLQEPVFRHQLQFQFLERSEVDEWPSLDFIKGIQVPDDSAWDLTLIE